MVFVTLAGCGKPAQIGPDKATFKAVDALYTAISMRDPKLVNRCEISLNQLKADGKLLAKAADSLASVIAESRAEKWEPAQNHLHDFMLGQQR